MRKFLDLFSFAREAATPFRWSWYLDNSTCEVVIRVGISAADFKMLQDARELMS